MRDFTLKVYRTYLEAIRQHIPHFLTFREFMSSDQQQERYCLIRHDVDRKPGHALNMAKLEAEMGIKATYYFRTKDDIFKPSIIKAVADLGHETGYHYESLSDTDGNMELALEDFEQQLTMMRKIVEVQTVSMHGRPLKPYDNRDIWKDPERKKLLKEKFDLIGEVYLDIDYTDIAYINDTGRNWMSTKSNRRDKVESNVPADFPTTNSLLQYLKTGPHPKMVFQVHPERWSDQLVDWTVQYFKDSAINRVKAVIALRDK